MPRERTSLARARWRHSVHITYQDAVKSTTRSLSVDAATSDSNSEIEFTYLTIVVGDVGVVSGVLDFVSDLSLDPEFLRTEDRVLWLCFPRNDVI